MLKHKYSILTSLLVLALPLLAACGGTPAETTPTVDTDSVIATSIAQTMEAMAQTQAAEVTPTPESTATSDNLSSPTATTAAVNLPTATMASVQLPTNCLIAGLVSETIPDGTVIAKGASFTKEWRIINGGTCTWSTAYRMVYESGDQLGATSDSFNLTQSVSPGMSTTVSIKMTAPNTDGWYTGYWTLLTDAGVLVGRFSVNIYVGTPTAAPFAVTSVTYPGGSINVTCGSTATSIPITIKTDGAGTVTYYITSNYGAAAAGDATFSSAGSKTIYYSMVFPAGSTGYDIDIDVMINQPNNQNFPLRHTDANCK
jgi:hypothetical protein